MNKSQGIEKQYRAPTSSHNLRAKMNAGIEEQEMKEENGTDVAAPPIQSIKASYQNFNSNIVPKNAFLIVIASRRSGKSHLITHFLEEYTKKNKVDGVFLFSRTNAGFDGIPSNYRYNSLDILPQIIDTQMKVKKHNMKAKKKDKIKSNIIVILDDMIAERGMAAEMRKNPLLNKLAVNGRHLSDGDNSNMMVILISQIFTGIGPQIRLNTDFLFTTKLQARRERENIINSFLSLNSGRKALGESYQVFDEIVNADDFQFICIHTTHQNKKKFSDYIYKFKAPSKLLNKRLTGNADDWKYNKKEIFF